MGEGVLMNEKVGAGCAWLVILFNIAWVGLVVWGIVELILLIQRS